MKFCIYAYRVMYVHMIAGSKDSEWCQ